MTLDYIPIIFGILNFIGLATFVLVYKKIRNKFIRKKYANRVMWLILFLLAVSVFLAWLSFDRANMLVSLGKNYSDVETENKGLENDLAKFNQSENPLHVKETYLEMGDTTDFIIGYKYNLTWKLKLENDADLWISVYLKSYSQDRENKPKFYVADEYRNKQFKANELMIIPLSLDTLESEDGIYSPCIRLLDNSKKPNPLVQEICDSTLRIKFQN